MISFVLNRKKVVTSEKEGVSLLDFIRLNQGLTGTREACREGECGACTVLIGRRDVIRSGNDSKEDGSSDNELTYRAVASCITPLGSVNGCHVVTVEGVSFDDDFSGEKSKVEEVDDNNEEPEDGLNTIQRLIIKNNASQCGYCTPGIVLSLTGFCLMSSDLTRDEALTALDGNVCRCTGYASIRRAAEELAELLRDTNIVSTTAVDSIARIKALVKTGVLPEYFSDVSSMIDECIAESDQNIENAVVSRTVNSSSSGSPVIVAGGTDLFVQKPEELETADMIFLQNRSDLKVLYEKDGIIHVGGAVSIEEFRLSSVVAEHMPYLKEYLLRHSSTILRNQATLAGNIVNASPIGDVTVMLLVMDAVLIISKENDEVENAEIRECRLAQFYRGYKEMDIQEGEIIKEIIIPVPDSGDLYNFEKVSNRKTLDIAAVNSAIQIKLEGEIIQNLILSAGGVAAIPMIIPDMKKFAGLSIEEATEKIAVHAMESVKPISDIRGSADYKKLLLGNLVRAHFSEISCKQSLRGKAAVSNDRKGE